MNVKQQIRNTQIRRRWFISFIIVMILPMLSAFMIFNFSLNEVEQLTSETNRAYL